MAICLFLVTDYVTWDNCNLKIGNLANFVPKFDNNFKIIQSQFVIWKSLPIWNWKIQLLEFFNYLIWFDAKNVEL